MATVAQWIQRLREEYKLDDHVAIHCWSIDDIPGGLLTKAQKEEIIDSFEELGADIGLNWDSLRDAIWNYKYDHNLPTDVDDEDEEDDDDIS